MELIQRLLPWKPLHIVPLGDIQWAGKGHYSVSLRHVQQSIGDALEYEKQGDKTLFLGMGDYIDFLSPSNRARLEAAQLYDNAVDALDAMALHLNDELYELALAPTRGKWLGMLAGHHYKKLDDGDTSDEKLAEQLGARYLGTSVLASLAFEHGTHRLPFTLWAHHGCGNGQTGYYPLTRLAKVAADWEGVDVFCMGHTTRQAMQLSTRIRPRWSMRSSTAHDLTHREIRLVGTGGYSKSYVEFAQRGGRPEGGYAEKGMMGASAMGSPIIHVTPIRSRRDGRDLLSLRVKVEG